MKAGGPMLGMMKGQAAKAQGVSTLQQCAQMEYVGQESVTVPAGTFTAAVYRDVKTGARVWASDQVPFGFVKSLDARGNGLVLTAYGTDATTRIRGTPQTM
jgi:hypothetical protein